MSRLLSPSSARFPAQASDVLPGGDEQLTGRLRADAVQRDRARRSRGHEPLELLVQLDRLALELPRSGTRDRAARTSPPAAARAGGRCPGAGAGTGPLAP